jgi:hypothetical protein
LGWKVLQSTESRTLDRLDGSPGKKGKLYLKGLMFRFKTLEQPKPYRIITPDGVTTNRLRTSSLFLESYDYQDLDTSVYQPLWTLGEIPRQVDPNHVFYDVYPNHTFPSLRTLYLSYADPIEFNFAMGVFGSDRTWRMLLKAPWFQPYIEEYRQALTQKLRSDAVEVIRKESMSGGKLALQAAKWLAEQGYEDKASKGRPSKKDIESRIISEVSQSKLLEEDAERIGVKVNQT